MTENELAEKNAKFAKGVMELAFRMGYVTRDDELVRCKDCRFCNREIAVGEWQASCRYWNTHSVMFDDWCSRAERAEE